MALAALTAQLTATFGVSNAGLTQTGAAYNPLATSCTPSTKQSLGTSLANNVSGGADQVFSFQQAIAAGASATINLQAMTNLCQQASATFVRLKGLMLRLLSAANDSTISPAPNANSQVVVSNNGPALPAPLFFDQGGSGLTLTIGQSGGAINSVSIGAAGSGYTPSSSFLVLPAQAGGSGGVISVTTNSSGVPTAVAVVAGGSGYSNGTVPAVAEGHYRLTTGNAVLYVDVTAGGTAVSSTEQNFKVWNLDQSNGVTVEIDLIGGST